VSRALFLFFFVLAAFLAGAAGRHFGGPRLGELRPAIRAELHQDGIALKEDVRIIRNEGVTSGARLRALWVGVQSDSELLAADAHSEAKRLAENLQLP
jgi:hypothetical protein